MKIYYSTGYLAGREFCRQTTPATANAETKVMILTHIIIPAKYRISPI
jgi:hypothetical protein